MGVEPLPPASQAGMPTAYTTDTMLIPAEGAGVEPARPLRSAGFQPGPVTYRVALPFLLCLSVARPGVEPGTPR